MITMLVLNLPPALEGEMVDYLLSQTATNGFTSYKTMGHGDHENYSIAEQVSGRRARVQFELLLEEEALSGLVAGLEKEVGKDITYWQQQVKNIGRT